MQKPCETDTKFSLLFFVLISLITNAQTKIIAHRGYSVLAPENTLAAFEKAIAIKANYFELDVHKANDGTLVVIHDSSVDRTSSNQSIGKVSEMNHNELSAVKVGYPEKFGQNYKNEKIPTLREALTLSKGKIKVCIEIKVFGIEQKILQLVEELEMQDEVILFSFHYPVLAKIRQLNYNIPVLYLINSATELTIDYAKVIHANAIGVGYGTTITKELLQLAHDQNIEIWKWTVNNEDQMKTLIDLGLDGLITDDPEKALKLIQH